MRDLDRKVKNAFFHFFLERGLFVTKDFMNRKRSPCTTGVSSILFINFKITTTFRAFMNPEIPLEDIFIMEVIWYYYLPSMPKDHWILQKLNFFYFDQSPFVHLFYQKVLLLEKRRLVFIDCQFIFNTQILPDFKLKAKNLLVSMLLLLLSYKKYISYFTCT